MWRIVRARCRSRSLGWEAPDELADSADDRFAQHGVDALVPLAVDVHVGDECGRAAALRRHGGEQRAEAVEAARLRANALLDREGIEHLAGVRVDDAHVDRERIAVA